jgi:hypothetical protein
MIPKLAELLKVA